jgi:hypothetical protein
MAPGPSLDLALSLLASSPPPLPSRPLLGRRSSRATRPRSRPPRQRGDAPRCGPRADSAGLRRPEVVWARRKNRQAASPDPEHGWTRRWYGRGRGRAALSNTDPSSTGSRSPTRESNRGRPRPLRLPAGARDDLGDRAGWGPWPSGSRSRSGSAGRLGRVREALRAAAGGGRARHGAARRHVPGYLTELFNTPYIWGSAERTGLGCTAERRMAPTARTSCLRVRRWGTTCPITRPGPARPLAAAVRRRRAGG